MGAIPVNSFDHVRTNSDGTSEMQPKPSTPAYGRLSQSEKKFLDDLRNSSPLGSLTVIEERAPA
jgi:hypothetical protein